MIMLRHMLRQNHAPRNTPETTADDETDEEPVNWAKPGCQYDNPWSPGLETDHSSNICFGSKSPYND